MKLLAEQWRGIIHAVILASAVIAQNGGNTFDFGNCCSDAQDATAFAIAYSVPLVAYANFTEVLLKGIGGPNKIIAQQSLSDPNVRNVVKPNVDTVYTISFIDLSRSDLVFTIPSITDGRYWVFPFYDPYGDNFAELSSVNNASAGDYLIRRADDAGAQSGLEMVHGNTSQYQGIINYPTTYGALVARILVKQNTTEDISQVHAYQKATMLTTLARAGNTSAAPDLTPSSLDTSNITDPNSKALTLLSRMAQYNQPTVISDRSRVNSILSQAGISNGSYAQPSGVNLTAAQTAALNATQASVRNLSNLNIETNGWILQNLSTQGNFGTDYASRYYIALNGYLQLVATEAEYPTYAPAQIVPTTLGPMQAYLFTFFGKPPTLPLPGTAGKQGGFWSLTAYGADQFLIPNALGRYEIGDRSAITYPDGTLVYSNSTSSDTDASLADRTFQVLLQPQNVAPPQNWTSNWLPAPAGGGDVLFLLRWYAPSQYFNDGTYQYPLVEKIDAIV